MNTERSDLPVLERHITVYTGTVGAVRELDTPAWSYIVHFDGELPTDVIFTETIDDTIVMSDDVIIPPTTGDAIRVTVERWTVDTER